MHPVTSVLFANTSRLAPESRFCGLSAGSTAKGLQHAHLLLQEAMQLLSAVVNAQPVCGIHHPDQSVCLLEVVTPVRAQRLLAADVPYLRGLVVVLGPESERGPDLQMLSLYLTKKTQQSEQKRGETVSRDSCKLTHRSQWS